MTTTALPTTMLEGIEALDFQPDVACESLWCAAMGRDEHPADWWALTHCQGVKALCQEPIDQRIRAAGRTGLCVACGQVWTAEPHIILGPVRS